MSLLSLDPELASAIHDHPVLSKPIDPPPEGTDLVAYGRKAAKQQVDPLVRYYGGRLPPASSYHVVDKLVPVDGAEITVRCITPVNAGAPDAAYPVLVWYHGGGWRVGDLEMDDNLLRTIAVDLQLVTVNVDYRLSPEYSFPTPFEDCYAALKWVAGNATELQVALAKGFLVGGDSAGGSLAATVALKARDDPFFAERGLTGQFLREPLTLHPSAPIPARFKEEYRAMVENKDAPLLNAEAVMFLLNACCPNPKDVTDLRISPLLAPSHAGLPRAYIQVMERDPLRDDGVAYEKALREAGVDTKIVLNPGVAHGFQYTFPAISAARKLDRDARDGLRWLLSFSTT